MLTVKKATGYRISAGSLVYLALIPIASAFLPLLVPVRVIPLVGGVLTALALAMAWHGIARGRATDRDQEVDVLAPDPDDERRQKLLAASELTCRLGPGIDLAETKCTVVDAARAALATDLIAMYTIDPCMGNIECDCSDGVGQQFTQTFLELFDQQLTDPTLSHAWLISSSELTGDARQALADHCIREVVVSPIRSETSACGALIAIYRDDTDRPADALCIAEVLAAQASTAISYAHSLEQSRYLLDDLAGANQELSLQATVDGLTGLPNHRTFQQSLTELCRKVQNGHLRPFCLVMVDVDHFKIYNDTHGHREGDSVLQRVAKTMAAGLRQGDMAARYGGEEFTMIFQGTTKEAGMAAADRIRRAIPEQSFRKGVVTVSMGLAEFPTDAATPGELIERADKALYHAKATGRNRVFGWGTISGRTGQDTAERDDMPERQVLLIGDDADFGEAIVEALKPSCALETTETVTDAAELLKTRVFDVALVSIDALPGRDTRSLTRLAAIHPHMPIVLLASDLPAGEAKAALRCGASDILLKPYNASELPVVIERNIERQRLELQRLMQKSNGVMLQAIEALVSAIEAKDKYTAGHSRKVAAMSMALCDDLKISNEERFALELAAKLHDIGKVGLPDSALNKQSPLTDEEWQSMREHPALGAKIVGAINELAYVSTIIRHHHERLDGTGYPDGLSGPAIPYMSRIIAVADAYEAMTSERAHRSRLTPAEAIAELRRHSGTYYEPEVVEVLEKQLASQGDIPQPAPVNAAA